MLASQYQYVTLQAVSLKEGDEIQWPNGLVSDLKVVRAADRPMYVEIVLLLLGRESDTAYIVLQFDAFDRLNVLRPTGKPDVRVVAGKLAGPR